MARYLTELRTKILDDGKWKIVNPLVYGSDMVGFIVVPEGFITDFASVPRIPIIYAMVGNCSHRAAVIHDYLYRIGAEPDVTRKIADDVFYEAMGVKNIPRWRKWMMWAGVRIGGHGAYKKLKL